MKEIIQKLEQKRAQAKLGGGEARIAAQHAKGKLSARERIEILFDEDSFEEWDIFVEHRYTDFGMDEKTIPGDGVVTEYGNSYPKSGSQPISRVLSWTVIHLGHPSPNASSNLPRSCEGALRTPTWSCSRRGLPCRHCCQ